MKNLANKNIQRLGKYSISELDRLNFPGLLLDANERTVPLSKNTIAEIMRFSNSLAPQCYPNYHSLTEKVAQYCGVNASEIALTNGSDRGIETVFRTFTQPGDKVIIPFPTFSMFTIYANISQCRIISPKYNKKDFSFPLNEILKTINSTIKLIVICNPNNPTGTLVSVTQVEKIARKAKNAIVLVDEAYFEFSNTTSILLLKKYPNIIITRTFSKAFGLAGLRLGYLIASSQNMNELSKLIAPYDVSATATCAGLAVLSDLKDMKNYSREVMLKSKPLLEKFFKENKIEFYNSAANFIFIKLQNASEIVQQCFYNGLLIRELRALKNYLRITIGSLEQTKQCIQILSKILFPQKYAFFDRDGTLIFEPQDTYQIDSISKLKILEGAIPLLQRLKSKGYRLIMISNQNGVGTINFPTQNFKRPHQKMLNIFKENKIEFDEIFICPHMPEDNCHCRKPKTGLITEFLSKNTIDKANSFMCGDRNTDAEFASNIGIKFIHTPTNNTLDQVTETLLAMEIL